MTLSAFWRKNQKYILWGAYAVATLLFLYWIAPIIADQKISRLIQATVSGILLGGIYALTGLGIVVVTKASGVFNFAHGFMMVVGGLLFWTFFTTNEINVTFGAVAVLAFLTVAMWMTTVIEKPQGAFWNNMSKSLIGRILIGIGVAQLTQPVKLAKLVATTIVLALLMTIGGDSWRWMHAIVGTVTGSILLGLTIERFAIRPLVGQPLFAMVLMTLAVTEVLQGFTQFSWGPRERTLPVFDVFKDLGIPAPIRLDYRPTLDGMIIIRTELLIAFVLAIVAVIGFILFFRYAQTGLAMRAVSEDQQLAQSVGLRVREILAIVWGIAALLAGMAGVLSGGATSMTPAVSLIALRAFPAVLLGGLESIEGVLVGGIVVGLVEQWSSLLFPGMQAGPELAPYLVLMIVLVIRPEGLFGEKLIERI